MTPKRNKQLKNGKKTTGIYHAVWRWHFYAGLIFMPFLLLLAITGGIYLFKAEIEQFMYQDLYQVEAQGQAISPAAQIDTVMDRYPEAIVDRYRPGEDAHRSAEVGISNESSSLTVFVDPYTGEIVGDLPDEERLMDKIVEIHGELMAGTTGDRIVELAACWAIILIVTGIYLWRPKRNEKLWGVLLPRFSKGKKIAMRDLHAVPAFWISAGMFFLIMTGLPWSGLWGNGVQTLATSTGAGYPPSIWVGEAPTSEVKTEDIADVSWAAENLDVPSSSIQEYERLSIDDVVDIAEERNVYPSYDVFLPQEEDGVYTLSVFTEKAEDEATLHIDQYTGAVLADYRFQDYAPAGKLIAMGITLHEGTQFGLLNQLTGLIICIGIAGIVVSGFLLWWKRKPAGKLGAPKAPPARTLKFFTLILILLGILFPLVGISLLFVWIIDFLVIKRIPKVQKFLNA
ncbi:PepSY-associated TM helix domain-containing protein [Alteribacillus sp. HJP-4]|uniref:PepSY-associated TM helix domain-containing protein n=1 Tax=Alteribacillus sp. HJP-4 TaxID=2775394 RepID=UPI0035CD27EA